MPVRIAVDAMGGDRAPAVVVEGAVEAARKASDAFHVMLVGRKDDIGAELDRLGNPDVPLTVVDAPEVIEMDESPAQAVKTRTASSVHIGLGLHKQGKADAFVSAGNTGAVMAASLFILGRLPNVSRPSIIGYFPTTQGDAIVLDVGANVDCKPEHLVQFARMGSIYAQRIMGKQDPLVGLMSVGEEASKGNELTKAANALLAQTEDINFRGNIEGRDLMLHGADVAVCDGFVGNIMLKLGESVATAFVQMIAAEMERLGLGAEDQQTVARVVGSLRRKFNYEEYGGAPLLGVSGTVLIGHGSSTPLAIERMITKAVEVVEQDVTGAISSAFEAARSVEDPSYSKEQSESK